MKPGPASTPIGARRGQWGNGIVGLFDHLMRDVRSVIHRDGGSTAIPPLDGGLSPNDRLDACVPIGEPLPGVDDVVADRDGAVYVSAGRQVLKLSGTGLATPCAGRRIRGRRRRPGDSPGRPATGLRRRPWTGRTRSRCAAAALARRRRRPCLRRVTVGCRRAGWPHLRRGGQHRPPPGPVAQGLDGEVQQRPADRRFARAR